MKKFGIVILAIGILGLTACGIPDSRTGEATNLQEKVITLVDGREMVCVVYSGYNQGGLSCDWNSAK